MPSPPRVRALSREEVRALDARAAEEFGVPTLILMENAGRGAADWLVPRLGGAGSPRVVILCGPGNNGGDGAVVARHLDGLGCRATVLGFLDPARLRGDAATQWAILERSGLHPSAWPGAFDPAGLDARLAGADWVVDALLGTGLTRPVSGPIAAAIEAMNRAGKPVLSLDLPSGLDADTGRPLGDAVRATATVTFVAPKLGFAAPGADGFTGEVVVISIGAPRALLRPFESGA